MGYFNSKDIMMMGYFDFVGLMRILRDKGYELRLYFGERDDIHIQLTHHDSETARKHNVKEVVSLRSIEQCQNGPSYALCNIFIGLMERLDRQAQDFKRYVESVGGKSGNEDH